MPGVTAFIYGDEYLKYDFGPFHPFRPDREKKTLELLRKLGVIDDIRTKVYEPRSATEEELMLVHDPEYIYFVREKSEQGYGLLDYGDTPATKGIYEGAAARAGGSILGADLIMQGEVTHAFNPGGGLHHARRNSAAGFCVFNDVALAARYLQRKYELGKIAIVDIDGHHGDGTQEIFNREKILTISFHRYGFFFYPGTGGVDEIGEGEGYGYAVNVPLPAGTNSASYLYAFKEIVPPLLRSYEPQIILHQFGVDSHYEDPLVGLSLTTAAYKAIAETMHELAHELCNGRYLIFGGGGYAPENVARCWAVMFITVAGKMPENKEEYIKLFDRGETEVRGKVSRDIEAIVRRVKEKVFPLHGVEL